MREHASQLLKYKAAPDSGFFLDRENIHGEHVYGNQMKQIFSMSEATSGLNQVNIFDSICQYRSLS